LIVRDEIATHSDRNSRQPTIPLENDHTEKGWNPKAETLRSGGVWKEVASPTGFSIRGDISLSFRIDLTVLAA
jgi:hypothetical protein